MVLPHSIAPLKRPIISNAPMLEQIEQSASSSFVASTLSDNALQFTIEQRDKARLRTEEQRRLSRARKHSLVLDLDHTLLHSIMFAKLNLEHEAILSKKEKNDVKKPNRHLLGLVHLGLWTKLRPEIWNFLEQTLRTTW